MNNKLWYESPASEWKAGLPIGTGRLAAMILGGVEQERVSLNHEWLWRGKHQTRDTSSVEPIVLQHVRELLMRGEYEQGTIEGNIAFGGGGNLLVNGYAEKIGIPPIENKVDPYQPAGDFMFKLGQSVCSQYKRELNLDSALAQVMYETDQGTITRRYIAHPDHDLIIAHISSTAGNLCGTFWIERIADLQCTLFFEAEASEKKGMLSMDGLFQEGLDFRVEATVKIEGGSISVKDERLLEVSDAQEILIFINVGTSAKQEAPQVECSKYPIPELSWEELLHAHIAKYKDSIGKLRFDILQTPNELPTDQRLGLSRQGKDDPGLPLLFFHYARYLIFSSSHTAELPAHLQGKWNEQIQPPWNSDYHHDINLQFSYWPMEAAHLEQYTEPLFSYMERMVPRARKAAKDLYGCRGILFPLQTDCWSRATPESFGYAVWVGAAAWLAQHMWWSYEYSQDIRSLEKRIYPFFKQIAAFYEDYLIEDTEGVLQTVPSQSPENKFAGGGNLPVTLCVSSAMDIQLVQETLKHAITASELLNKDEELRSKWTLMLGKLPALKVGKLGQLLEWNEEFEELQVGHRHLSHLIGLYPGDLITKEETPELFEACRISLERRLSDKKFNGRLTRAWVACIYARMGEGEHSWRSLNESIVNFAPHDIFLHTDIMHAVPAAVCEMLVHSYHEKLRFLPALPEVWKEGKVSGLRARGGYTIDLEWRELKLYVATIKSVQDRTCIIKTSEEYEIRDSSGSKVFTKWTGIEIHFSVKKTEVYTIVLDRTSN